MNYIKKIIPKKLKIFLKLFKVYAYDFRVFIVNSSVFQTFDTENKLKGKLTIYYHVLEKGLTMPETKLGFGQPVVYDLIELIELYILKGYNITSLELVHSINVLEEYLEFHQINKFDLDLKIIDKIKILRSKIKYVPTQNQFELEKTTYFENNKSSFEKFSLSRYSLRNYTDTEIPIEILHKCIQIAMKSPTSCNRQLNRIYAVRDKKVKQEVLKLQYGNRGFGHLADTIFVITADISVFQGTNDRNESYINSGMFAMSLLYALHRYEIGACPLNWSVEVERDLALRKLLGIPKNERVGVLISCGYLPDKVKIASSPRLSVEQIIKII
jgi:nitroreductase